ncbi:MAG: MmgE/PrpD family protein [Cognatishimia sp.]
MSTPLISRQFAQFACHMTPAPSDVIAAADRAIFDTLGAILAGGAHDMVKAIARLKEDANGPCLLATRGRSDALGAALVNGMAAHVWDIDDTSYTGIMHASAVILPALLAVAQQQDTDPETLRDAFIAGSEITYVLADICTHDHYFHGWWSTVTFGLIGTTAAVGVLLQLDEAEMTSAIGLAAASAGGGKVVFGTDAKPLLVGEAAQRAIQFAEVAKAGVRGPENAFEDSRGYFKLLNNGKSDGAALETLGQRWRLIEPGLLFKSSPVCSAGHAAIEQMAALMETAQAKPEDVKHILAEVPELVHISLVYPNPKTPQEAQFSLPYAVACAAIHGRVRFEDLHPDAIGSLDKVSLIEKLTVGVSAELSTEEMRDIYPESARLTLELKDGRSFSGFCGSAYGMPDRPLSDQDLEQKFTRSLAFAGLAEVEATPRGINPLTVFAKSITMDVKNHQQRSEL